MKKLTWLFAASLLSWSTASFASPLMEQWAGTGADADKIFCKYGDGEVKVIYGNQNCPLSN
ncbi:hypothetical protein AB4140_19325 [Shewanella sp. 10N.286.51.B2]|uniref:Uncharacterized protein n=1 Tax=Rheinheimera salexigens TaxID=1628148 RepID=A0A1E7Q7G6_9GAMM|nr:hypothetical protein [Rheinheimera salexigens]OEY70041.1 hypothetical protein BI198_11020 [Rheinheimera salexigens]|tara:strand:+ start:969 stop:1151 length:183 start_codon:yes stop_codon:yes gene_type:complete